MADEIVKKYKVHRVSGTNSDGSAILETVHPETEAGQVLYTDTIGGVDVGNVDEALVELKKLAQNSGVTSVNGKTGKVTLTPVDIGAVPVNDTPINAGVATKITYNSYGVITGGSEATLDDIPDGTTRKIPTDYIPNSQKGANGGVATLDTTGKVPTSQLPSYVDDVVEYANLSGFPTTGVAGKIYVDKQTNKTYRWSGTGYTEISASLALGETSSTAYAGDKGKKNADDIASIQTRMQDIEDGEVSVGHAEDADKLGGMSANEYALEGDVSDLDDLFVAEGSQDTYSKVISLDKTYTEIKNAISDLKIPVLHLYDPDYETYFAYQYVFKNDIKTLKFICVDEDMLRTVLLYEDGGTSYSSKTLIDTVTDAGADDTGSSAIISKIEKSGSAVSVTRRAMTNNDLPTPVFAITDAEYSAVRVNSKGIITAGGKSIEWGTTGQTEPSNLLMNGGLFFELVEQGRWKYGGDL